MAALIVAPGKRLPARTGSTRSSTRRACTSAATCYQATQGLLAIADGGWFGVGLGKGGLKWGWLPSGHNDFIFAIIAEELGVVGCLVVLALFAVLAYTGLRIARRVHRPVPPDRRPAR